MALYRWVRIGHVWFISSGSERPFGRRTEEHVDSDLDTCVGARSVTFHQTAAHEDYEMHNLWLQRSDGALM